MSKPIVPQTNQLFPSQQDLLRQGYREDRANWLICAPTGSGKTLMGEWAMLDAIADGYTAAYIAPLKAIVEEKTVEWSRRYPDLTIGLYTGDSDKTCTKPNREQILLFTPEKLNAYLQGWKGHLSWLSRLGVLVIDEFHFVGDRGRGACLEALVTRLKRVNPFVRIVGLSATMSNSAELATWLKARVFSSAWRPVPLDKKVVRFKKASEKNYLLMEEVEKTVADGGKVLVFVNSRKRAESVARHLAESGLRVDFNHAGLSRDRRTQSQEQMRQGETDVLVATSTLEMGVNFPARKVVIHDTYAFDGETFAPLPVQRYLQFSGRAGRAGLDETGESVIFLPTWDSGKVDYLGGDPEPVRSGLFSTETLLREVLCEVAGRLSISERHLEVNFAKGTLWRTQGGSLDLKKHVTALISAGLMKRSGEEDEYLNVTALGRVASQMGVAPGTVMLLADLFRICRLPTTFDLLLTGCLAHEATPHLGFNFEEIEEMTDTVLKVPSHLLDRPAAELRILGTGANEKRILSAVKCASILHGLCQGDTSDQLAERFDAYPLDIEILRDNVSWVLETGQRVFAILHRQEMELQGKEVAEPSHHETVCRDLGKMLQYGIPFEALGLVEIEGIGPKRAQGLVRHGIMTPEELLNEDEIVLSSILRMRPAMLEKIIAAAEKATEQDNYRVDPFERDRFVWTVQNEIAKDDHTWKSDIDPYRLRRALELNVEHCSTEAVRVSGGTEPHTVQVETDRQRRRSYSCDCLDFAKGHHQCKHVIRARLELRDDTEIVAALKALRGEGERLLRYGLGDLWLRVGSTFDQFNDRKVDYGGEQFLKRLQKRGEWRR